MTKKTLAVLLMLVAARVSAVQFAAPGKTTGPSRTVASDDERALATLAKIKQCADVGQSVSGIRACAKDSLDSRLEVHSQDRLLAWFKYPFELSAPTTCAKDSLKYLPVDKMTGVKRVLCARYSIEGVTRQVMLFFVGESASLRLSNIKEQMISPN